MPDLGGAVFIYKIAINTAPPSKGSLGTEWFNFNPCRKAILRTWLQGPSPLVLSVVLIFMRTQT